MATKEERHQSRITAVETIFSFLGRDKKISAEDCFRHTLQEVEERIEDPFAWKIVEVATKNLNKIQVILKAYAPEFPIEKIAPVNVAILIAGIAEMRFIKTPPVVVINEYIELAKIFGEEKSFAFVNGVLDEFRKQILTEK